MNLLEQYRENMQKPFILRSLVYHGYEQTMLNRAYAIMLTEQGLLTKDEQVAIDFGIVKVQEELKIEDINPASGDLYYNCEKLLSKFIGEETACKLHIGRSRNDMYFTLFRMEIRKSIWQILENLASVQDLLEKQIEENVDIIIPYYTYGQPAQPGTWGHYLLTLYDNFLRDFDRIKSAYNNVNLCPMGSAASIGTSFPINKYRVSELLGFDGVIENTLDAIGSVDYVLETQSAFAILNTTINKVAADMMFFSTSECNILNCDMSICGGSSIMPQKKNAEAIEKLRSTSSQYTGYYISTIISAGSISLFPTHDSFSYLSLYWDHINILLSSLSTLKLILHNSKINKEVALKHARDGFTGATAMAEQLTILSGEPFVKTHHVVGGMIDKLLSENNLKIHNMTSSLIKEISLDKLGYEINLTDEEILDMLEPISSLNTKVTGGTPKPDDTRLLLKIGKEKMKSNKKWFEDIKLLVENAYNHIEDIK